MFNKVAGKLNNKTCTLSSDNVTSPVEKLNKSAQKSLLRKLSEHALSLYQKKIDIKNFTKLVLSDPDDKSHEQIVKDNNIDEYDLLFDLTDNEEFLKDLGL